MDMPEQDPSPAERAKLAEAQRLLERALDLFS